MKNIKVSNNVIRRLPRYLRKLDELMGNGVSRISSFELGQQLGLTPSQIRQDFSCFGEFGQQGYGYNVDVLREEIGNILGVNRGHTIVVVGAGNRAEIWNPAAYEEDIGDMSSDEVEAAFMELGF